MAGLKILYNLILKDAARGSGQASGILSIGSDVRKIAMNKYAKFVDSAKRQGVDLDKLSEQEIKYMLELNKKPNYRVISEGDPEFKGITRNLMDALDKDLGKNVIQGKFGKPFGETITDDIIRDINNMETIPSMKEMNKVIKRDGRYKNLTDKDVDKIFKATEDRTSGRLDDIDPEDMYADGGVAGLLGERTGYNEGGSISDVLPADFDELDPEELIYIIKLLRTGEIPQYASGGRIGFSKGKLANLARRNFMKLLGVGAAGIGALKTGILGFGKGASKQVAKDLTEIPIQNAEGMPSWFKPLVNRVIKEGDDVTKQVAWKERQIVHSAKLGENQGVKVYQDLDNQTISVEYQSADNMGGIDDSVNLEYKAAEEIPIDNEVFKNLPKGKSSVKTKPTFEANEAYPLIDPKDYKDVTFQNINTVTKVDDLISDTSALKQFGTNKDLTKKELAIAKQKRKRVKEIHDNPHEELAGSQYVPDPDDFASGGLARMLGE